jgi:5-methylcytosine-specific restriction endonuclease McrA
MRMYNHERRALLRNATVERFRDVEIFERDGWICGICGDPVDPELRAPDPMSKSLDHIYPLARGGAHSRANVQLAHLRCNNVKNATIPGDSNAVAGA